MIDGVKRLLPLVILLALCAACGGGEHACSAGREIVLRAVPQRGETLTPAGMELARRIMEGRVSSLGVGSPTVEIRGSDEIAISGSPVPKSLARVVSVTGNLQFFDFEKDIAPPTVENGRPTPYPTLYSLLAALPSAGGNGGPETYYLLQARAPHRVIQGPVDTLTGLLAPYSGKIPKGATVFVLPPNLEVVSGTQSEFTASTSPVGKSPDGRYWYLFKLPPEISSSDLKGNEITAGSDPNAGSPQVALGFNAHGAKEFQAITKAEYDRGRLVAGLHGSAGTLKPMYAQHNAIVLDDKLEATPYIDYTDSSLSLGIAGGQAVIANLGSMQAANRLALVLRSGSLPYRFELVSSKLCRR